MLVVDERTRLIAANRVWIDLAGDEVDWTCLLEPEARRRMEQHLRAVTGGEQPGEPIDVEMLTRAGRHWTRWWSRREVLEESPVVTLVVIDVHDEVSRAQDLRVLAAHDHMTGLLNRRFFIESVAQAQRRAQRSGGIQALLYVDLDHFKVVNDLAGHAVGDQLLAQVGRRLQAAIRGADLCARLGGDEFAVLLEDATGPDHAEAVAARIVRSLAVPLEAGGDEWTVSASVGVAMAGDPDESPEAWLHRADAAMYARKRVGQPVVEGGGRTAAGDELGGGAGSAEQRSTGGTLERLRSLRDDLVRVSQALTDFDSMLRA
jgi:diguanylate cyclase (GGDEF)-like protein